MKAKGARDRRQLENCCSIYLSYSPKAWNLSARVDTGYRRNPQLLEHAQLIRTSPPLYHLAILEH
jgi:hypothetical protein